MNTISLAQVEAMPGQLIQVLWTFTKSFIMSGPMTVEKYRSTDDPAEGNHQVFTTINGVVHYVI